MALISIGGRIKRRRKELNLSALSLAKRLSVSKNTMSRWETGARIPDIEKLYSIANALETTFEYLVGSDTEIASNDLSNLHEVLTATYNIIVIPIYDLHDIESYKLFPDALGIGSGKAGETMVIPINVFLSIDDHKKPFAVKMLNRSMSGAVIDEEDFVVINPSEAVKSGDPALVLYYGTAMIRWVCYTADGRIELQAANPDYKTIVVDSVFINNCDVFRVIGLVVSAGRLKIPKRAF